MSSTGAPRVIHKTQKNLKWIKGLQSVKRNISHNNLKNKVSLKIIDDMRKIFQAFKNLNCIKLSYKPAAKFIQVYHPKRVLMMWRCFPHKPTRIVKWKIENGTVNSFSLNSSKKWLDNTLSISIKLSLFNWCPNLKIDRRKLRLTIQKTNEHIKHQSLWH